jgi:hypothetical protein
MGRGAEIATGDGRAAGSATILHTWAGGDVTPADFIAADALRQIRREEGPISTRTRSSGRRQVHEQDATRERKETTRSDGHHDGRTTYFDCEGYYLYRSLPRHQQVGSNQERLYSGAAEARKEGETEGEERDDGPTALTGTPLPGLKLPTEGQSPPRLSKNARRRERRKRAREAAAKREEETEISPRVLRKLDLTLAEDRQGTEGLATVRTGEQGVPGSVQRSAGLDHDSSSSHRPTKRVRFVDELESQERERMQQEDRESAVGEGQESLLASLTSKFNEQLGEAIGALTAQFTKL